MNSIVTILQWTLIVAIVFLLVTNASGVAKVISTFGSFWTGETKILTGQ